MRELIRFGCARRTLEKICSRKLVDDVTLHEYERMISDYKLRRKDRR